MILVKVTDRSGLETLTINTADVQSNEPQARSVFKYLDVVRFGLGLCHHSSREYHLKLVTIVWLPLVDDGDKLRLPFQPMHYIPVAVK